jgi:hypothetical protein
MGRAVRAINACECEDCCVWMEGRLSLDIEAAGMVLVHTVDVLERWQHSGWACSSRYQRRRANAE